jgi:hypothetical protein
MDASSYHQIVPPLGNILFNEVLELADVGDFPGAVGARIHLSGITGADFANNRATVDPNPALRGSRQQGGIADALFPTLTGEIRAPSRGVRTQAKKMMQAYLETMRATPGVWHFREWDEVDEHYFAEAYVFGEGVNFEPKTGVAKQPFTIALFVPDPTVYTV